MPDEPTAIDAYVAGVTADVPTDVVTRIVRLLAERHATTRPHQPTRP
jgi:hypothetical protein